MTERIVEEVRALLASGQVPRAILMPRCDGCSLREVCMPEIVERPGRIAALAGAIFRLE